MSEKTTRGLRAEHWRAHIEAWQSGRQSQRAYCRAHELSYSAFLYWRRKFARGDTVQKRRRSSALVAVTCAPPAAASGLRLVLPNGLELRGLTLDNVPVVEQLLSRL